MKKRGLLIVAILIMVSFMTLFAGCGEGELEEELSSKLAYDMSGVTFKDATYTYDGTEKTLEIVGDLPSGVSVSYTTNKQTNAGSLVVTASFSGDSELYSAIVDMSATLTIYKAPFTPPIADETIFVYTGSEQTYLLEESEMYTVSNTTQTDAGEYIVTVSLNDKVNYAWDSGASEDLEYAFTIAKATYDMSDVSFEDATYTYDGNEQTLEIAGDLPSGVTVNYTTNTLTNAGSVEVTASFSGDSNNYELIADKKATLTIDKATYDMSDVSFVDATYTYDGTRKSLEIAGDLPSGVTVSYTTNTLTNAGSVEVTASFSGDSNNYELIADKKATLTIDKATYDMSDVSFVDTNFTYDGTEKSLEITGDLPSEVIVNYTTNTQTNVGSVEVTASFSGDSSNYELIADKKATLTIDKATYNMSGVSVNVSDMLGSSGSIEVSLVGDLPDGVTVLGLESDATDAGEVFTVQFSGDSDNYELIADKTATVQDPVDSGYTFWGWYTDKLCTSLFSEFAGIKDSSIELYVGWSTTGLQYSLNSDSASYSVISSSEVTATSIIIPSLYNGLPVTSVAENALKNLTAVTSVYIPANVTSVGDNAFDGCSDLMDVYYCADMAGWLNMSFGNASSTPMKFASNLYVLDNSDELYLLEGQITIDSVTAINSFIFYGCAGFTSLTIEGSVKDINAYAFYGCTGLVELEIAGSVINIYDSAFYGCTDLVTLTIGQSVLNIKEKAFQYCTSLQTVNYNATSSLCGGESENAPFSYSGSAEMGCRVIIGDNVEKIDTYLFGNFENLTSATIGDSVKSVGNYAFYGCSRLGSITIGASVASMGTNAFGGCEDLTDVYYNGDGDGLSSISYNGEKATPMYYATSFYMLDQDGKPSLLKELVMSDSVTSIGAYQFYGMDSLESVTISNSVLSIGNYAFRYCSALETVVMSENVASIGMYAFDDCSNLQSISVPDGVTEIQIGTFQNCSSLTTVTIGEGVTSIANNILQNCTNLQTVYYNAKNASIVNSDYGTFAPFRYSGSSESGCEIIMGDEVETIGNYMFYDFDNLTKVSFGASVVSIGTGIFQDCAKMTAVTIPATVSNIGVEAFQGCSLLASVTIKAGSSSDSDAESFDGETSIGESAFAFCTSLTSMEIPDGVKTIGVHAFKGCTALASVVIGKGIESIGIEAFDSCSNLTELYYTGSIEDWCYISFGGSYASPMDKVTSFYLLDDSGEFEQVTSLELTIPSDITSIGAYQFYKFTFLTSVTIPEGVTSIDQHAFSGCTSLVSVNIPYGVTSIGNYAFYSCGDLTTIDIPNSVTSIGNYAFRGCDGVTSLTIGDSVESIGNYAFSYCREASLVVPASVTSIGANAFLYCSYMTSLTFEDTTGWYYTTSATDWANKTGGTEIDLTDASENATNFKSSLSIYKDYYLYKI